MASKTFAYIKVGKDKDIVEFKANLIKEFCLENNIPLNQENIFVDKVIEGKQIKMDNTQALKNLSLNSGDLFIIKELSELGDLKSIKDVWQALYVHGVDIIVVENQIFNTYKRSLIEKKLKSDILIELLIYLDENMDIINKEIKNIYSSSIGRPKEDLETLTEEQLELLKENFDKFNKDRSERTITAEQFMSILGLKRNTFYKIIKQYKKTIQ